MKILITGSEGIVGRVIKDALSDNKLSLIDKTLGIDILKDDISEYFKGIDLTIHLAANHNPWISAKEAEENVLMMWKVLQACRENNVPKVIYSSSIHVYDFETLYKKGERITKDTPIKPNVKIWNEGSERGLYSISKILCEKLLHCYSEGFGIKYLALRLGGVNIEDKPYTNYPFDFSTWLSHKDLTEIIRRAIHFKENASFACVSDSSEKFIELKGLEETLNYIPRDYSADKNKQQTI
jgi:uronate dehydrogenase